MAGVIRLVPVDERGREIIDELEQKTGEQPTEIQGDGGRLYHLQGEDVGGAGFDEMLSRIDSDWPEHVTRTELNTAVGKGQGVAQQLVGSAKELGPGSVRGAGRWAVLNVDGRRYAVSRRCRHLRADLAGGHIDDDGCLVCPWHQSAYDPRNGRMVVSGRKAGFLSGRAPGLGLFFRSGPAGLCRWAAAR